MECSLFAGVFDCFLLAFSYTKSSCSIRQSLAAPAVLPGARRSPPVSSAKGPTAVADVAARRGLEDVCDVHPVAARLLLFSCSLVRWSARYLQERTAKGCTSPRGKRVSLPPIPFTFCMRYPSSSSSSSSSSTDSPCCWTQREQRPLSLW